MLRYRLRTATAALLEVATRRVAITIPSGAILNVVEDLAHANRFVEVEWEGERVQMFAVDLRERGEIVMSASDRHSG